MSWRYYDQLHEHRTPEEDAALALGVVDSLKRDTNASTIWAYFPVARSNPYQRLLYKRFPEFGLAPVGLVRESGLESLPRLRRLSDRVWLHLHWTSFVLSKAASTKDAEQRVDDFLLYLDSVSQDGVRLAWTLHNVVPHDTIFIEQELRLRRELVARADIVHSMVRELPPLIQSEYPIPPEKLAFVPHPSYRDFYFDTTLADARLELGIESDAFVFLLFGALLPYKGLPDLVRAFIDFHREVDTPTRLIIAGRASQDNETQTALRTAQAHPAVISFEDRVPDDVVPLLFRASDAAVIPYSQSLNSGAALLAQSFGLPVVARTQGSLEELVNPSVGVVYREKSDLANAMKTVLSNRRSEVRARLARRDKLLSSDSVSEWFCRELVVRGVSRGRIPGTTGRRPHAFPSRDPSFLLLGTPRSGTTLLQRLCAEIEGIWVPPETHFFRQVANRVINPAKFPLEGADLEECVQNFVAEETSRALDLQVERVIELLGDRCDSVFELFGAICRASSLGRPIVGEKTPVHLRWWRSLSAANSSLQLFAVVRDVRAVVSSLLSVPWGPKSPWEAAARWVVEQQCLLEALELLGSSRVAIFQYENLVKNPESVQRQIAKRLGVGFTRASLPEGCRLYGDEETWKGRALEPVDGTRVDAWRDRLTSELADQIAAACEREMSALGYTVESRGREFDEGMWLSQISKAERSLLDVRRIEFEMLATRP